MSSVPKMSFFDGKSKEKTEEKSKSNISDKPKLKFCYFNQVLVTENWYRLAKFADKLLKDGIYGNTIKNFVQIDNLYSEKVRLEQIARIRRQSGASWIDLKPIHGQIDEIERSIENARFILNNCLARTEYFRGFLYLIYPLVNRYKLEQLPEPNDLAVGFSESYVHFASDIEKIVNCWEKYISENGWFNKYTVIHDWVYDESISITEQDYRHICELITGLSAYINNEKLYLSSSNEELLSTFRGTGDAEVMLLNSIVDNIDKMQEFFIDNVNILFSFADKFNMMVETDGFILLSYLEFLRDKYMSLKIGKPLLKYVFDAKLGYKAEMDYFYVETVQSFGDDLVDLNSLEF